MDNFEMTSDELSTFESQLRDPTFKALFFDYLKDLKDPKNKLLYEQEIAKLEAENGSQVKFINPLPGFCIKTTNLASKLFVNLCLSPEIEELTSSGEQYSIPYSLSKPKKDLDNSKKECLVYDVVFHPKSIQMGLDNSRFKHILILTAIEGIEKQFGIEIKRDYVLMKNMKVKGILSRTMIKEKNTSPVPNSEETSLGFLEKIKSIAETQKELAPAREVSDIITIPKFKIIHQNLIQDYQSYVPNSQPSTRPQSLLIKIELPLIKSISNVNLDVTESNLDLVAKGIYKLHLELPFKTISDKAVAKVILKF
jgi:dynein assembly factor 2, axonemal